MTESEKWQQAGADLSRVGWQFLHWLLTDPTTLGPDLRKKLDAALKTPGQSEAPDRAS